MNIDYLREYEFLCATLNFRDTARHFYVSPSVISRHVASLESELGVTLFDRSKQGVRMTQAGEIFLKSARAITKEYGSALGQLARFNNEKSVVRLGYLHNASRPFIVQFSTYLKRKHPEIEIAYKGMTFRELYYALQDDLVDINFMLDLDLPGAQRYESSVIYRDILCVVASNGNHLAEKSEGVSLEDMEDVPLLLPDQRAFPGLETRIKKIVETDPNIPAGNLHGYGDVDTMYIEVMTEDKVAFSTGANAPYSSKTVRYLPFKNPDAGINVNAYISKKLTGHNYDAVREAISACRKQMRGFTPERDFLKLA